MKIMKRKRVLAMLLSLVMCICLFPVSAAADYLSGDWERVSIGDADCYAYVLDSRLNGVTAFDLDIEVEMNANTRCENWDVWARSSRGGSFEKIGRIYLAGGNGDASKTIRLQSAMNIDAVAVTPTASGGYSWSMSMGISNPSYGSSSSRDSNSQNSSRDSNSQSGSFYASYLDGDFEEASIDGYDTYAFVLDSRLTDVSAFDVYIDMELKAGAKCENWNVWARRSRGGSFEKVGYIFLEGGSGETMKTIRLSRSMNVDAVAVTPNTSGRFSWSFSMGVANPSYGDSSSDSGSYYGGYLDGDWEEVTIYTGSGSITNYAFALSTPLRKCTSFDLTVEIEMKANTKCYNWDVWVRSNGSFYKVGNLYLSGGDGSAEQTIHMNPAKNVDAVAVIPTVSGSFSWSIAMGISNPAT